MFDIVEGYGGFVGLGELYFEGFVDLVVVVGVYGVVKFEYYVIGYVDCWIGCVDIVE